jgi:hypothetical protein
MEEQLETRGCTWSRSLRLRWKGTMQWVPGTEKMMLSCPCMPRQWWNTNRGMTSLWPWWRSSSHTHHLHPYCAGGARQAEPTEARRTHSLLVTAPLGQSGGQPKAFPVQDGVVFSNSTFHSAPKCTGQQSFGHLAGRSLPYGMVDGYSPHGMTVWQDAGELPDSVSNGLLILTLYWLKASWKCTRRCLT